VRITRVTVIGASASFAAYATDAMRGSYFGLIPRDSVFFYPASSIRSAILAAHPEVAAVSVARDGFDGVTVQVDNRMPVGRWCGPAPDPMPPECYVFDASGFIYATTSVPAWLPAALAGTSSPAASSDVADHSFVLFEALASSTASVDATLPTAAGLPAVFDFARKLDSFGSPATVISIHDGEADDYLASGTLVKYVLGQEQDAYAALSSAQAQFNLANGSVEYVDLRFSGKIYLKKRG